MAEEKKLLERTIPGMDRSARFAEVQHAENVGATLRHILLYFAKEKTMVATMLLIVIFGTLCGVYAPSLQSKSIPLDLLAADHTIDRLSRKYRNQQGEDDCQYRTDQAENDL